MSSTAPDISLMEMLLDKEDTLLKETLKDQVLIDDNYEADSLSVEWPDNTDDFLDSFLKLDSQFNLIDNNLDAIPSSSSDSGLSSALSMSCEQQLSPLLQMDDDHIEISNDNFNSPHNFIEFQSLDSPNGSVGSEDSPTRLIINNEDGSLPEDIIEEMEMEKCISESTESEVKLADIKKENIKTESMEIEEKSAVDLDETVMPIVKQEAPVNATRNIPCGKRNIRQLIRVTPVGSGNPRSILLPVSLKDMKEVRAIKIINAAQARNLKGFKINQNNVINKAIPVNVKQEDSSSEKSQSSDDGAETDSPYPRLKLNTEEKRLLQKEGITLPSHYPLTKHEERELKRIRRKIRNKISAQDSRKRKKEYVDGLEDRVKQCTEENMTLLKRIKALQTQNQSLAGQLKRLQALIQKGNKSAQPTTCLMVLLLSLALVALPNLRPHSNNSNEMSREKEQPEKMSHSSAHSRQLLFTNHMMDEDLPYGEELLQEVEGLLDHDYSPSTVQVPLCKRARYDSEQSAKYSPTVEHIGGTLSQCSFSDIKLSKKYIEPPLDDVWPPPNPGGVPSMKAVDKLEALTNELKINISDLEGTRTVVLKVPQEK